MSTTAPDLNSYLVRIQRRTKLSPHGQNGPGWEQSYEQLKPGPCELSITVAWLGALELSHESVSDAFVWRGNAWKGSRFFIISDHGIAHINHRLIPEHTLVSSPWDGIDQMLTRGSVSTAVVAVDERWFINRLSESTRTEFHFQDDGSPVVHQCDQTALQNFEREVPEILRQLLAQPAILNSQASRASVQNYVVDLLLQVLSGGESARAPLPRPSTRNYVVERAMQYIESVIGDHTVSMFDICTALRVSPSTLKYSFESVLGISPSRYLLATRLNRVHRDLRVSPPQVSIQQLATRWGFWHMGRFAKYYRETFGELPSDTERAAAARRLGLASV